MIHDPASLYYQAKRLYFLSFLLFTAGSCTQQQAERTTMVAAAPTMPFQSINYQLTRLDNASFLDSLRTLPRADSTLIKPIMTGIIDFDRETSHYRYRTFALGPNRAEVVAAISDFNGISAKLHLLLFTPENRRLTNAVLAFHYDGSGATEDLTSVQQTSSTFRQQTVVREMIEKPNTKANKDPEWLVGTTTAHYMLQFANNRFTRKQLDSTYIITPYKD